MPLLNQLAGTIGEPEILQAPYAPNWRMAALKIPNVAMVSGKGADEKSARDSCLGEAAELLSCRHREDDSYFRTIGLKTGTAGSCPAEDVTSKDRSGPKDPGNEGCAAGPTLDIAVKNAFFERIERHALVLWWCRQKSPVSVSRDWLSTKGILERLESARQGTQTLRPTRFLHLGQLAGISTILAVSTDSNNRNPVIGIAADSDPVAATLAAMSELFQMELALVFAMIAERSGGNATPHQPLLRRIDMLEGQKADLLVAETTIEPEGEILDNIQQVAAKLSGNCTMVDMTRADIGVPVVRILTSGLELSRPLKFEPDGGPL